MNQIILRQIPDEVDQAVRRVAKQKSLSLNKAAISLLKKSVGLENSGNKKRDLSKLAGTWSKKQAQDFDQHLKIFDKIDREVWE